ncbi:hypothetical protein CH63R_08117 [Colletotrichum higginsianum IMI 349063]|uniref:Uncharacterized protein n=1 Tax=Colletotrichum higginsianum (strain IMI 349063) TaxID=759273 RepID=A0A1B7YBA8_COLHI|nr:hypothetical protein CH63R_08117 [Colletotrichum higginsianum IMI 349063]OBR09352.1 hypothetical protein CH63R_08117 [Colletotrichum higginsianum IMI 349063]
MKDDGRSRCKLAACPAGALGLATRSCVWRGHGSADRGASHFDLGKKRPFATAHRHESGGGLMPNRGTAGVGRWALGDVTGTHGLTYHPTVEKKHLLIRMAQLATHASRPATLIGRPDHELGPDLVTHPQPPIRTTGPPRPRPPASKDELRPTQCLYEMCRHKKHGRFLR